MPSFRRMALGLLFLTGCAARRFSLVFIRPRTARGGSPNRPKPSALHKQGAVARPRLLNSGWREILSDDQVRDIPSLYGRKVSPMCPVRCVTYVSGRSHGDSLRSADLLQNAFSQPFVTQAREEKARKARQAGLIPYATTTNGSAANI
jgi:hypothetical protein